MPDSKQTPRSAPPELIQRLEFVERKRALLQKRLSQKFSEEDNLVWSIADLMTLLLIFFVMLYAQSGGGLLAQPVKLPLNNSIAHAQAVVPELETRQLAAIIYPAQDEERPLFGSVSEGPTTALPPKASPAPDPALVRPVALPEAETATSEPLLSGIDNLLFSKMMTIEPADLNEVPRRVAAEVKPSQLEKDVQCFLKENQDRDIDVRMEKDRAVFILGERITFHVGSADLREDFQSTLKKIADLIVTREQYEVAVSGHTDDTPIKTSRFPSNWELSVIRAVNVAKFLSTNGVDPKQLYVQGFSEYRPRRTNNTTAHKQDNRRVEIALINHSPQT